MAKKAESASETQLPDGLKSIKLVVENFKNLQNVVVDIGGRSMMFIGPNGSGKSALIQAMMSPMNSKMLPTEPIKSGEEKAMISHTIAGNINGEHKEYIMDLYFTKKDSKGRLVIKNELGEVLKSPATLIKSIIGNVSFDVTQWLNDEPKKKLATIKTLTGRGQDIDVISATLKLEKDNQKKLKDRAEELEAILANHGMSNEELELYSTKKDIAAMQVAMSSISGAQAQWDDINNKTKGFQTTVDNAELRINTVKETAAMKINNASAEILRLQEEIKRQQGIITVATSECDIAVANINKEADTSRENVSKGNQWLAANPRPSVDEVSAQINEAISHNEKCNNVSVLSDHQRELLKSRETMEGKKAVIAKLEDERSGIIKHSQLPIEGLTFDDDTLYLDGLPLEDGQINTARLWDVGVDIAMAMNPTLKIIFLHDANVFDKKHLHTIIEKIEARGYMAICEFVKFEGDNLEVRFTEEILK
jgi:ABC-type phosphate transport system ATPase subunit